MKMKAVSNSCTACGLCVTRCPKSAIVLIENRRREMVAQIDTESCVNCGLCLKLCPETNDVECKRPLKCYAAWTKYVDDYKSTSSGGIATVLSKWYIKNDGSVYGAEFLPTGTVAHGRKNTYEGVERLKGSKYVQSNFRIIYDELDNDIRCGNQIAIIGTPCQIAAVKAMYNSKELENVLLIDLVCHGVPPAYYFEDYLKSILVSNFDNLEIGFRKKDYILNIGNEDHLIYCKKYQIDPYYRSFMYGLIFRENCYNCKYAKPERVSDITLCDFWGLNKKTLTIDNPPKYVSCILINSKKGWSVFDKCKYEMEVEERDIKEALAGNYNLNHPSNKHKDRDVFIAGIADGLPFIDAVNCTSIKKEIMKENVMEVLKTPYRKVRYGTGGGTR